MNGEKRMPTQEEAQILLDRFMKKLGYERSELKKREDKQKVVV